MKPRTDLSGTAAAGMQHSANPQQRVSYGRKAGVLLLRAGGFFVRLVGWFLVALAIGIGLVFGIHVGQPLLYGACASIMHIGVFDGR